MNHMSTCKPQRVNEPTIQTLTKGGNEPFEKNNQTKKMNHSC